MGKKMQIRRNDSYRAIHKRRGQSWKIETILTLPEKERTWIKNQFTKWIKVNAFIKNLLVGRRIEIKWKIKRFWLNIKKKQGIDLIYQNIRGNP